MGKISPVSAKYIVHAHIQIDGVVDRPDIVGAIFGQTEGLLGADLELRELQRSGRIGRIEVESEVKSGKTEGTILIPSSLDKSETVIIAAALETIQRIGPCNAKVHIEKIEDVRVSKRNYVIQRAKELLKKLTEEVLPDSQEITEEVEHSVRMMGITEYGPDRLPAGPGISDAEEVIVVEGRADVLNLLKHGFKNVIALNGTSVPKTIVNLSKEKVITLFVDGDRGGDLIIKEVTGVAEIDYVVKAPDGKEVEELTKKELHKALRGRIAAEQAKLEIKDVPKKSQMIRPVQQQRSYQNNRKYSQQRTPQQRRQPARQSRPSLQPTLNTDQKAKIKQMLEDLIGTRGAYLLDEKLNILGKVPITELTSTIKSLGSGIFAVVFDGTVTKDIALISERAGVKFVIGRDLAVKPSGQKTVFLVGENL